MKDWFSDGDVFLPTSVKNESDKEFLFLLRRFFLLPKTTFSRLTQGDKVDSSSTKIGSQLSKIVRVTD